MLKGFILSCLGRGGCVLPLLASVLAYDLYPEADAHWRYTIPITAVLVTATLWLWRGVNRSG